MLGLHHDLDTSTASSMRNKSMASHWLIALCQSTSAKAFADLWSSSRNMPIVQDSEVGLGLRSLYTRPKSSVTDEHKMTKSHELWSQLPNSCKLTLQWLRIWIPQLLLGRIRSEQNDLTRSAKKMALLPLSYALVSEVLRSHFRGVGLRYPLTWQDRWIPNSGITFLNHGKISHNQGIASNLSTGTTRSQTYNSSRSRHNI